MHCMQPALNAKIRDDRPRDLGERVAAPPFRGISERRAETYGDAVVSRFDVLVTGAARYTGDIPAPGGALHLAFVRSTLSHGRIVGVDTTWAEAAPGVLRAYRAGDLGVRAMSALPGAPAALAQPPLAEGVVRYVGQPVVAIVAESAAAAVDATELVVVDYEPLPVVNSVEDAVAEGAMLLFPELGTNVARDWPLQAFGRERLGEVVVRGEFTIPIVAVAPMEAHAALAVPEEGGRLTMWVSTQLPHLVRGGVAAALGIDPELVRVIAPHVGGGFGGKTGGGEAERALAAAIAVDLGRPVRWVEDRTANLMGMQGRGVRQRVEAHAGRDGRLLGLRIGVVADVGAYLGIGSIEPEKMRLMACGPYRVPAVSFEAQSVLTNRCPVGAYRGPGRSEAAALLERCMDLLAAELALDPVEIRRRNLLQPNELPARSVTGADYESGNYPAALDQLVELAGYERLRAEQSRRRQEGGPLLGIGIATVLDSTAWAARSESVSVSVGHDGVVEVVTGTASAGQDHPTVFTELVQRHLPVRAADVVVIEGDTARAPSGEGTMGSRSIQIAGTAVAEAARVVAEKARQLAASLLEAAVEDVVAFPGQGFGVSGVPASVVSLKTLREHLVDRGPLVAGGDLADLGARCLFEQQEPTHPNAAHLAVVEVDPATGRVRHLRHVAVTDCGEVMDRASARGQVIGATVQGAAQALYEELSYDAEGNPRNASLAEYLVPSAADVPPIECSFVVTRSGRNALGAKGVGEIGMLAAPVAVQNAVIDALAHLGVRHIDIPCTPEKVWRAIDEARRHPGVGVFGTDGTGAD